MDSKEKSRKFFHFTADYGYFIYKAMQVNNQKSSSDALTALHFLLFYLSIPLKCFLKI